MEISWDFSSHKQSAIHISPSASLLPYGSLSYCPYRETTTCPFKVLYLSELETGFGSCNWERYKVTYGSESFRNEVCNSVQRQSLSILWFVAGRRSKETCWLLSYMSLKFHLAIQICQPANMLSNLCSIILISCHQFGQVKKDPNSINKHW